MPTSFGAAKPTIVQEAPIINADVAGTLSTNVDKTTPQSLKACVHSALKNYYQTLDTVKPKGVYKMLMAQVEPPLIISTLAFTRGNQSKAAILLGISRGGLFLKCRQYNINLSDYSKQFSNNS